MKRRFFSASLFRRIGFRQAVDKPALIEPFENPVVDRLFRFKILDGRVTQFHQRLNVAQPFNRRLLVLRKFFAVLIFGAATTS